MKEKQLFLQILKLPFGRLLCAIAKKLTLRFFAPSISPIFSLSLTFSLLLVPQFARAQACYDSFIQAPKLSADSLWLEKPFKPGTEYVALSKPISQRLFNDIVTTTTKLLTVCGPGCLMVGIGRSPTPIIAQAQIMNQYAINMPLSDFRPLPGFNETSRVPKFAAPYDAPQLAPLFHELSPAEEALLFQHFDKFLGPRIGAVTRVLLVDFSQSGASLFATQRYVERWLATKDRAPELKSINIGDKSFTSYTQKMQDIWGVTSYRLSLASDSALIRELHDGKFDDQSEYSSYELGGSYSENIIRENGTSIYPYYRLRNSLTLMNLARTNDSTQAPKNTRLPKDVYWDLTTGVARNSKTGEPVLLRFE